MGVEKVSLAELRAASQSLNATENQYLEEQKRLEEERKLKKQQKEQQKDQEIQAKIDDFFAELEAASPEDRDGFFKLLEEDMKKGKK